MLGWQLYCHPSKSTGMQGWQYNCHPNEVFCQNQATSFIYTPPRRPCKLS